MIKGMFLFKIAPKKKTGQTACNLFHAKCNENVLPIFKEIWVDHNCMLCQEQLVQIVKVASEQIRSFSRISFFIHNLGIYNPIPI